MAWRLFRDAADEDYLLARISMRLRLHHQFYWSAQQALEKYLKCALILNGGNASSQGHDLKKLFDEIAEIAGGLIPTLFVPPNNFPKLSGVPNRGFEIFSEFVDRMNSEGSTNVRYRAYSIAPQNFDLHKLDELCFQIRRICIPLTLISGIKRKTYRELLFEDPDWQFEPNFGFMNFEWDKRRDEILPSLKWRNFAYYRTEANKNRTISVGRSVQNSPVYLTLKSFPALEAKEALEWLMSKTRMDSNDKTAIRGFLAKGSLGK